jgi:hypothetical protein
MDEPANMWADGEDFMAEAANLDDVDLNAAQVQAAPNAAPMQAAPDVHDLNDLVFGIAHAVRDLLVQGPNGQIAVGDPGQGVPLEQAANLDDVAPIAQVQAANAVQDQAAPNAAPMQANGVQVQAAPNAVGDLGQGVPLEQAANLDDMAPIAQVQAANAVQDQAPPNAAPMQAPPNVQEDPQDLNGVQVQAAPNAVGDLGQGVPLEQAANLDDMPPIAQVQAANAVQDQAAPNAAPMQAAPNVQDFNDLVVGIAHAVHALLVQGPNGQIAVGEPMEQGEPQNEGQVQDPGDQLAPNGAQDVATGANQFPVGPRECSRHDLLERYPGAAQALLSVMEAQREIRAYTIDNARMISKRHLVVQGARIPPIKPGEDVTMVFIDFIAKEVGIWIRLDDIGQVHRRHPNGFIVEFLNRKSGSAFTRLLRVKPGLDLQIEIRLIEEDKKIFDQATQMLHSGLIRSFYVDTVSGKVTVVLVNGRIMSISDEKKIIALKLQLENLPNY